jgi:hypothetical protein
LKESSTLDHECIFRPSNEDVNSRLSMPPLPLPEKNRAVTNRAIVITYNSMPLVKH